MGVQVVLEVSGCFFGDICKVSFGVSSRCLLGVLKGIFWGECSEGIFWGMSGRCLLEMFSTCLLGGVWKASFGYVQKVSFWRYLEGSGI